MSEPPLDLAEELSRIARTLHERAGLDATIDAITASAAVTVPGAEIAAVARRHRGVVIPTVLTDDVVTEIDRLQTELMEGPCLSALNGNDEVVVPDLAADGRWPTLGLRAAELGVRSALCYRLDLSGRTLGALSIFARPPHAFDDESRRVASLFAVHAALALAGAAKEADLTTALSTRDLIGQAKGILMERHGLSSDGAFAALARLSQTRHLKLVEVAATLVRGAGNGRSSGPRPRRVSPPGEPAAS